MARTFFHLSKSQIRDVAKACSIGVARLDTLAEQIEAEPITIRGTKIEKILIAEIGEDGGSALFNLLFGIASTFRRTPVSAKAFLDRITPAIKAAQQDEPPLEGWDICRPAIERLLTTQSISLAAKALDVSYDFERVYVAGRILTSIRPIFDDDREQIHGSTIVQTLRVEYIAPNGDQSSISIAVDADDIKQLLTECERAVRKADVAKLSIEDACNFEAIIPGEEMP